jgi:hypothetical protein
LAKGGRVDGGDLEESEDDHVDDHGPFSSISDVLLVECLAW